MDRVAMTACWMAAVRARETARPDRLFDDPLAATLAGPEGVDLMHRMEAGFPENPTIPIRTRFFDDALVGAVAGGRIGQVVVLAAHGWAARACEYGDDAAHFGRWPYPPMPRDDPRLPHSYLIVGAR
ncbi:MAG TPA: class I SAM-dependent methyltransferase [Acidimicrobiales bacterium]|nr:class I SAM-dependent methyltransferase [Acidimicrobiales bacterium]